MATKLTNTLSSASTSITALIKSKNKAGVAALDKTLSNFYDELETMSPDQLDNAFFEATNEFAQTLSSVFADKKQYSVIQELDIVEHLTEWVALVCAVVFDSPILENTEYYYPIEQTMELFENDLEPEQTVDELINIYKNAIETTEKITTSTKEIISEHADLAQKIESKSIEPQAAVDAMLLISAKTAAVAISNCEVSVLGSYCDQLVGSDN